jgi:hypothetical protein
LPHNNAGLVRARCEGLQGLDGGQLSHGAAMESFDEQSVPVPGEVFAGVRESEKFKATLIIDDLKRRVFLKST